MTARDNTTTKVQDFFDKAAPQWQVRYRNDARVAARLSLFSDAIKRKFDRPIDVLDFGCGSGDVSLFLDEQGHRVAGCDLSEQMIAEARGRDDRSRVIWRHLARQTSELPFDAAAFDVVVASSVFEYLPDVPTTLQQIARVLRPGGWLFATVPDMRNPQRHREQWLRRMLALPGLVWILGHSRWAEGASYLLISINRVSPDRWLAKLRDSSFSPDPLTQETQPLLLLSARRTEVRPE